MISQKEKDIIKDNARIDLEIAELSLKRAKNKMKLIKEMEKRRKENHSIKEIGTPIVTWRRTKNNELPKHSE